MPTKKIQRLKKGRLAAAAAIFVAVLVIVIAAASKKNNDKKTPAKEKTSATSLAEQTDVQTSSDEEQTPKKADINELKQMVSEMLETQGGDWSVYFKKLDTGESFLINDRTFYPASTIKLFAMAAAYQQIYDGIYSEETLYPDISAMASESNNVSFNNLVWDMGNGYITKWCAEHGLNDTYQYTGLYPADNADGLEDPEDRENQTSAKDIGKLLEDIYNGECVSKLYSARMMCLLLDQEYRDKIPAGIPQNVAVANKTGETYDVSHDSAIVCAPSGDYILVIMCDYPDNGFETFDFFTMLSQAVYEYLN